MSATRFAGELAERLQRARCAGEFARLILVADKSFLELLCAALDPATLPSVLVTMRKDLLSVPLHRLADQLP
jgi:protein required for attachment to host cells